MNKFHQGWIVIVCAMLLYPSGIGKAISQDNSHIVTYVSKTDSLNSRLKQATHHLIESGEILKKQQDTIKQIKNHE